MKKYLKSFLIRCLWFISKSTRIHSINRMLVEINYNNLIKDKRYIDSRNLINYGFKVYSQADEDGIIDEILNRISFSSKTFIELGVQNGKECNTLYLLKSGWKGLWVDMSTNLDSFNKEFSKYLNKNLIFEKSRITTNNINSIIEKNKIFLGDTIDVLSIDLSKNTFHILEQLDIYSPRVIVTEYNAKLRDKLEWKCDYNDNGDWEGNDNFGASLKSFQIMLEKKGYNLVGCNITGTNAFFVKKDLINDKFINNFSSEFHYEPLRLWLIKKYENELKVSI